MMIKSATPRILVIVERSTSPYYQGTQLWLGPLYLLSYLEKQGINGDFLDRNAEPDRIVDYSAYDIIGFSANVNNIKLSIATAKAIKSAYPEIKIIFGGPFASSYPLFLMEEEFIDAACVGEGEETFYEYIIGKKKREIPGLYYRENGTVHSTGSRTWNKDLDLLPFPALQKAKLQKYSTLFAKASPLSYIITTRGCPYPCTFCFHNMGKKWRARSPQNVVDEIEWQVSLGVKEIGIVDDNFTLDRKRVIAICDEILRRNIKVKFQFHNGVRADFVDEEMMEKLSAAGLWVINYAPESGSAETISRLKKGFRDDSVSKAIKIAKKYNVAVEIFLLLGLPWETKKDFEQTLALPYDFKVDFVHLSKYVALPGTELQPGQLTAQDKENLFSDRLFSSGSYNKEDEASKMIREFSRRWYGNPKRILHIIRLLNLYEPNRLLNPDFLGNMMMNSWMKLGFTVNKQ